MEYFVIITAGGRGARMGASTPKQYLKIGDRPILGHTLRLFDTLPEVSAVTVTSPAGEEARYHQIIADAKLDRPVRVVTGGADRQDSVRLGLAETPDCGLTAIHDGVRPFVSREVIRAVFQAAAKWGAAIAAAAVTQTVKRKNGDRLETIPRENLWLAHTPQAFRTELIKQAHATAHARGILGTDDAALVERLGYPVAIVPDDDTNIKITSPADLEIAGALYRLLSGRDRLRRDETAAEAR